MTVALNLARRNVGITAPNPSVGCVIVKQDKIIGTGVTAQGGRPHAETEALDVAGKEAKGGTAYVTLEPCSHAGETGPCAKALIDAGVKRVVIATQDSNPEISGKGMAMLEKAGIEVALGVCEEEARKVNEGFFTAMERGRPFVTLKLALTLDGRIATRTKESQWITGPRAREYSHYLRLRHDAILVGVDTVIADNPQLTCRLPGLEHCSPIRVVADSRLRTPKDYGIIQTAKDTPTWLATLKGDAGELKAEGLSILELPEDEHHRVSLPALLKEMAGRGVTRLLCEGGGKLAAALLKARLVDRLVVMHGPKVVGGDGIGYISTMGIESLASAPQFHLESTRKADDDLISTYVPNAE
jgi:diaminohydroxyphosphoribosylaminopyrimidine deaminase/5-amino-6-(5-phosphoribosylamino)uracil reductase